MVLMSDTSSKVSWDPVYCFGGIKGISGHRGLVGGVGGDWGSGEELRNEMGRLGLGARQFSESEGFGFGAEGSLWGGGSLQLSEWQEWGG